MPRMRRTRLPYASSPSISPVPAMGGFADKARVRDEPVVIWPMQCKSRPVEHRYPPRAGRRNSSAPFLEAPSQATRRQPSALNNSRTRPAAWPVAPKSAALTLKPGRCLPLRVHPTDSARCRQRSRGGDGHGGAREAELPKGSENKVRELSLRFISPKPPDNTKFAELCIQSLSLSHVPLAMA